MESKTLLRQRVKEVCLKAYKDGISVHDVRQAFADTTQNISSSLKETKQHTVNAEPSHGVCNGKTLFYIILYIGVLVLAIILSCVIRTDKYPYCALNHSDYTWEMTRPIVNCDFCKNLYSVPIAENNIERECLIRDYASTGVPVLIKGATKNWTAMSKFNYRFIRDLYFETDGPTEFVGCEYLQYASEYETLEDFFRYMPESMGDGMGKPWYIAWHICWPRMREELSKYYQRPSFLLDEYATSPLDYMFMGVAGRGALLHLDFVMKPTWQAQITGRKSWNLLPPTECQPVCHNLNVTVDKGEIFVFDSSLWFHSTIVHPGEISIAIGKEFD